MLVLPSPPDGVELVTLPDNEMWLMQPVLAGLIPYTELHNPKLRLSDIGRMNDALAVKYTNERLLQEWANKQNGY
jgi:hypothetical protein